MFPVYDPPHYEDDQHRHAPRPSVIPKNPFGKTGLRGPGCLPEYGANPTSHLIITRLGPRNGRLQVCVVPDRRAAWRSRRDRRLPPGVPSKWDTKWGGYTHVIYSGYIDDECNTDNAWYDTTATHIHIPSRNPTASPRTRELISRLGRARWATIPDDGQVPRLRNVGLVCAAAEIFGKHRENLEDSTWALNATLGTLIIVSLIIATEEPQGLLLVLPGIFWITVAIVLGRRELHKCS